MTPALRLAISLVLSLLLWLPTVPGALTASEDPARIAGRYLLSLLVARIGVGLVFRVISSFSAAAAAANQPEADEEQTVAEDTEMLFGRRRSDLDGPGLTEEAALDDALDDAASQAALVP